MSVLAVLLSEIIASYFVLARILLVLIKPYILIMLVVFITDYVEMTHRGSPES